jgi:uncharacterized protein YkwD
MRGGAGSDTSLVATGRRAYTVIRRHLLGALACAVLLALCACCCALASTTPASTPPATPRAKGASSYTSSPGAPSPKRHRGACAHPSSFHTSVGVPGTPQRQAPHRRRCRRRAAKHHTGARNHAPSAGGSCANTRVQPNAANLALVRAATLCLVNRERTSRGESALRPNEDLQAAAQGHSTSMSSDDYFEHDGPGGSTPLSRMRAAGYIFSSRLGYAVGENIAWGTLWLATPKAIVAGWMSDPGHRANILDATFRDSGVGVSPHPLASLAGGESGAIYTQDFGRILH